MSEEYDLDGIGLVTILAAFDIATHEESAMQRDIAVILDDTCAYVKECILAPSERIDFLINGIGVECKIAGSKNDVLRQLSRYAEFEQIEELVLVTTRASHRDLDGITLNGKRVHVHWVSRL